MPFRLTKPCPKCPFRNDINPYLMKARAQEITAALLADESFPCHNTVNYDTGEFDAEGTEIPSTTGSDYCAGAMIVLEKMNRPNQMMRIGERLGLYDRTRLDMQASVFNTLAAWCKAQPKR